MKPRSYRLFKVLTCAGGITILNPDIATSDPAIGKNFRELPKLKPVNGKIFATDSAFFAIIASLGSVIGEIFSGNAAFFSDDAAFFSVIGEIFRELLRPIAVVATFFANADIFFAVIATLDPVVATFFSDDAAFFSVAGEIFRELLRPIAVVATSDSVGSEFFPKSSKPIAIAGPSSHQHGQRLLPSCFSVRQRSSLMSPPLLITLWRYARRFQVEELFLDSKAGAFELEASGIRSAQDLERLYLVVAIAILYGTTQGMAVHISGLRSQVAPPGVGASAISKLVCDGSEDRSTRDVLYSKSGQLFAVDPEPCFTSRKEGSRCYDRIWFSRIHSLQCQPSSGRGLKDVSGSQVLGC